jgi:hypothetical protein
MSNAKKDLPMSDKFIETRNKLNKARTGILRTKDVKNKISNSKKGHTVSDETRLKISNTLKLKKQNLYNGVYPEF